ncbi:MAG TPA: IMP cyclohydrolase [Candidatus Hydrogenedentes bacterium]|nr:IMP cyclohydrolase [Candidatus Hydrogenedentota bacterium]
MYVGRIVSIAMTKDSRLCGVYRVSSRSFPNRTAVLRENRVSIVPKPGHEADVHKNPYIAYNCVRVVCGGDVAVVTNGSHTDPIAEKIMSGMNPRDALLLSLMTLDYEKDDYNTPRIAGVVDKRNGGSGYLGIVREDGLDVRRMPLEAGMFYYVATYEEGKLSDTQSGAFPAKTAPEACQFLLGGGVFAERTHPVTAVAAMSSNSDFELAALDAPHT